MSGLTTGHASVGSHISRLIGAYLDLNIIKDKIEEFKSIESDEHIDIIIKYNNIEYQLTIDEFIRRLLNGSF